MMKKIVDQCKALEDSFLDLATLLRINKRELDTTKRSLALAKAKLTDSLLSIHIALWYGRRADADNLTELCGILAFLIDDIEIRIRDLKESDRHMRMESLKGRFAKANKVIDEIIDELCEIIDEGDL
jgi:hypothetical protein